MQSRLLDGKVLKGIHLAGSGDIEKRADLAFANHVFIIGAARAWTSGLASRVLDKLANFFLKGHVLEKIVDLFLDARLGESRSGRTGAGNLLRRRGRRGCERAKQKNEGCYGRAVQQRCHVSNAPYDEKKDFLGP